MKVKETVLRTVGLSKRFGRSLALAPLDLELSVDERLVVLGPNGAGKSTFLRILGGLLRASSGEFSVERHADSNSHEVMRFRSHVGLVSHQSFLYPSLSINENLVFTARLYGLKNPIERASEIISIFDLEDISSKEVKYLSRGMVKRASIARSVIHDPELLLLDEPFAGLDLDTSDKLQNHINIANTHRRSLIMASHDLVRASQVATRFLILYRGYSQILKCSAPLDPHTLSVSYKETIEELAGNFN